jgi:hypothetical protein
MEKDIPLPELFKDRIIIIYAVVIGISFDLSKDVLLPVYLIPQNVVNALILFLGYFIVLSSWSGYFSSMKKYPHKGNFGFGRFIFDLLILFVFYYIVIIRSKHNDMYLIPDILSMSFQCYFSYLVCGIISDWSSVEMTLSFIMTETFLKFSC